MNIVAQNLEGMRQHIAEAAQSAGREAADIRLVAVSKTKSEAAVRAAYEAGQKIFGENRVQEAKEKFAPLRGEYRDLRLHLIGPLQTNKIKDAIGLFDVIETLDRPRLAVEIAKLIGKASRTVEFYIEVNIGEEPQKAGVMPEAFDDFLALCREACGLRVTGVMAIPPQHEDPVPYFDRLREIAERHKLPNLSMGMSGDFEAAIRCGTTEIRLGTAIFGPREER